MDASETVAREVTVDEAVALGILLQQHEQLGDAGEVFRVVLESAPDHPAALHYAGVLAHQQGRSEEALTLIQRSLAVAPDHADSYSNLGIVLQSLGRHDDAISAYRRAISIDPNHANAHSNLGIAMRATGHSAEAEAAYRTAIRLNPEHVDAYTNLGILLNGLKRTDEAAQCYSKVITLRPQHREARRLLALAHCTLGEVAEAVKIFEDWLVEEPADPVARHMLAACTGRDVPARASADFVERTFDSFAASFESKLERLSYRAPELVVAMLQQSGLEPLGRLNVLDVGCGTGLAGPLVAPYARSLVGVDLSEQMLTRAKEKQVYDELTRADLVEYLRETKNTFDVIVAVDTLVYFGNLDDVFAAAAEALRPNGLFVFTLERAAGLTSDTAHHRLEVHGRYSHHEHYVRGLLALSGLEPEIARADLRMEAGLPVAGLVVRATKRSAYLRSNA